MSVEIEVEWSAAEGTTDTDGHASKATFDLYEDNAVELRRRLRHDNGEIIADGGQGYALKQKAKQGHLALRWRLAIPSATAVSRAGNPEAVRSGVRPVAKILISGTTSPHHTVESSSPQ